MAPTNPVPSKAALNALRGILFTTSCSVFLLAEERRRRLKIARAAIDNARKLHTVRSNRGPIALGEGLEGRLSDLNEEVLSHPAIPPLKNSYRRRRRDNISSPLLHDGALELHKHTSEHPESADRSDGASIESKKSQEPRSSDRSLDSIKPIQPAPRRWKIDFDLRNRVNPLNSGLPSHPTPTPPRRKKSEQGQNEHQSNHAPITLPRDETSISLYSDALENLEKLLADLEENRADCRPAATTTLDRAIATFLELKDIRPRPPTWKLRKRFKNTGVLLLRRTFGSNPKKTNSVLKTLLQEFNEHFQIFNALTRILQEKKDREGLEQLLQFLSAPRQMRFWMHGLFIHRALGHSWTTGNSEETKQLYQMLQTAGLFKRIAVRDDMEYKIRRFMVKMSLEEGDEAFAQKELQSLYRLDPEATKTDVKLQSRLIVRKAALGNWDSVRADVETLTGVADIGSSDFQCMLAKIANIFRKAYSPKQLEALLRRFVRDYGISLRHHWVNDILDHHASRHQLDEMFSWLQFCSDSGLVMTDAFIQNFYFQCRKYWGFSDRGITNLHQVVQESIPNVSEPYNRKEVADSPVQLEWRDWVSESDAFTQMVSLATHEEWSRLCEAYTQYLSSGLGFSARCLRLAALAHINKQDGSTEQAAALVDEARVKGDDVTEALTPLLLARLEDGDDANDLIREALQEGIRIHDSVYNKAAQILSEKGDMRGAATICDIAAKENGNGELLYNEYNFANLVFAYVGSANYKALQSILSEFISEVLWWRGSAVCKETIKLAMKTAALRAVANPQDKTKHQEALKELDEAFVHVKKCRSNWEDRQAVADGFIRVIRPLAAVHEHPSQGGIRSTNIALVEKQSPGQVQPATKFYKQLQMASRRKGAAVEV